MEEIKNVIQNNKSPGCDGLPWEFYKILIEIFLHFCSDL